MMSLATELFAIADDLRVKSTTGAGLDPDQIAELTDFLSALARLAHNQEQELSVFRLTEAGDIGRTVINDLATQAMGNLMIEDNKIIRPEFGRKKT
ncbi:hypothetical protein [Rhizobium rhizogenes]|jgi:hypothetical protein